MKSLSLLATSYTQPTFHCLCILTTGLKNIDRLGRDTCTGGNIKLDLATEVHAGIDLN
jgi:hypothetical protein